MTRRPGLSVGKRNLLERIARSRMARDARRAGRHLATAWAAVAFVIGTWVMLDIMFDWLVGP